MEQMPGINSEAEGLAAEVRKSEITLNAKNKMQFALALDILRSNQNTKEIFSEIHDESELMELNPEHPEIEEFVLEVLARIRDHVRNMVVAHPEVIDHIASQVGDSFDYPLRDIDLSEAKKYLPNYSDLLH